MRPCQSYSCVSLHTHFFFELIIYEARLIEPNEKNTREKWTEKNWVWKKEARRRELKLTQFWLLCQSNERSSLNGFLVNRKIIFIFSLFHLVYSSNNHLVITLQVLFSFAKLSKHDIKLKPIIPQRTNFLCKQKLKNNEKL